MILAGYISPGCTNNFTFYIDNLMMYSTISIGGRNIFSGYALNQNTISPAISLSVGKWYRFVCESYHSQTGIDDKLNLRYSSTTNPTVTPLLHSTNTNGIQFAYDIDNNGGSKLVENIYCYNTASFATTLVTSASINNTCITNASLKNACIGNVSIQSACITNVSILNACINNISCLYISALNASLQNISCSGIISARGVGSLLCRMYNESLFSGSNSMCLGFPIKTTLVSDFTQYPYILDGKKMTMKITGYI